MTITWMDFVLDDVTGPILAERDESGAVMNVSRRKAPASSKAAKVSRDGRLERPSVMEDARVNIQETGQELQPARMVGYSDSDSNDPSGMEATGSVRAQSVTRLRKEEG